MREETIPELLHRAHDLIDEAISIIEDLREQTHYKPGPWFARAETHARAAKRNFRKGLGVAQHVAATAGDCPFGSVSLSRLPTVLRIR
jgi:hypothetical protein